MPKRTFYLQSKNLSSHEWLEWYFKEYSTLTILESKKTINSTTAFAMVRVVSTRLTPLI
jgi:hypothetical protein